MWRFCLPLIIFMSGQSLMWAQLHEYKVPCAGISLFTFQIGRNYTSVSTFTLMTVSPPRVWSAETAQSIEELITVSPPKRGSFLCLPLLPSLAHGPAASLVLLWVRCLSDPSTGCISLLSQQKTKPVKKKKKRQICWVNGCQGRSSKGTGLFSQGLGKEEEGQGTLEVLGQLVVLPSHVLGELCCCIYSSVRQHAFCGQKTHIVIKYQITVYCLNLMEQTQVAALLTFSKVLTVWSVGCIFQNHITVFQKCIS